MASSSSFAPPKLADFILTERLGSGSYATVYKAYRKVGWRQRHSCPPLRGWIVCIYALRLEANVESWFLTLTPQRDSREVVAVKVVAKKTLNKASTENLLTEIEILKTVRHPHIVQLKDFQVPTAAPRTISMVTSVLADMVPALVCPLVGC